MKRKTKLIVGVTTAVGTIAAASGIAVAVWSANGSGLGAAGAAIAQQLTVTASTPTGAAANLYPGGPAGTVYATISNPNPWAVNITSLQWGVPTSTSTTTCASSNISIDANAPTTASITLAAHASGTVYSFAGVLDLSHNAPDGCQGVTFLVQLTVLGVQQ